MSHWWTTDYDETPKTYKVVSLASPENFTHLTEHRFRNSSDYRFHLSTFKEIHPSPEKRFSATALLRLQRFGPTVENLNYDCANVDNNLSSNLSERSVCSLLDELIKSTVMFLRRDPTVAMQFLGEVPTLMDYAL